MKNVHRNRRGGHIHLWPCCFFLISYPPKLSFVRWLRSSCFIVNTFLLCEHIGLGREGRAGMGWEGAHVIITVDYVM